MLDIVETVGYTTPTPIQAKVIPAILAGRDVLGCAQTGTGKTASFTLPIIDKLSTGRAKARMPRSLILEPTRELAIQVGENFTKYSHGTKLKYALLIGGESPVEQEKILVKGVDVLIVTPGRLLDLFEKGKILLHDIKALVLDEADRMLDMGFMPDIEKILKLLPANRQTLLFSATMPTEIRRLSRAFQNDPLEVTIEPSTKALEQIKQYVVSTSANQKSELLRSILQKEKVSQAIIFCNRKLDVDKLSDFLNKSGFKAAPIHSDLTQLKRTETLAAFKSGDIQLLIGSDVAARGLDIKGLPFVFNFDIPNSVEDYVHRIGRTGRAGELGTAISLLTKADAVMWSKITKHIKDGITEYAVDKAAKPQPAPRPKTNKPSAQPPHKKVDKPTQRPAEKTPPPLENKSVEGFGDNVPDFFRVK